MARACRATRRRKPDPRRAARLREGDQGAGRLCRARERARRRLLRCLDARTAGERFRHDAAVSGKDARSEPRIRRLLRALRAYRRSADRRCRRRHDHGLGPRALRRAAARACADGAGDLRSAAGRRLLPARRVRRGGAVRFRPRSSPSASATTSRAAASIRRIIRSAPNSRSATCASPPASTRTTSAMRCSRRCTRPATRCTSRASAPRSKARRSATGTSAGVHESQSRLWENVVGRSRGFWQHFYPPLQQRLSGPARRRAARHASIAPSTRSQRSLIRTDADEVTYNLHVMLRFDLELNCSRARLAVKDLPEAWHARHAGRSRHRAARRPRRLPAGRALVRRRHRRRASRATRSAIFSARSSMRPRSKPIPKSRARSRRANSTRCTAGCATTSTGTAANSRPTRSSSARPASR